MREPVIQLPSTSRLRRRVLGDCRWKIKTFVERDAYVDYDFGGGYANPPSDVITRDHVRAMHCAMRGRSSNASWSRFTGRILPELLEIPYELDLADGLEAEVHNGWDAVARLAHRPLSLSRLTDVSVSMVLHLLRPKFVAISNSYVRRCLGVQDPATSSTSDLSNTLMAVQRGIGGLAKSNKGALNELFAFANALSPFRPEKGQFSGMLIPVKLSKIRILDIILWTDVAIHDEYHVDWSRWYANEIASVAGDESA